MVPPRARWHGRRQVVIGGSGVELVAEAGDVAAGVDVVLGVGERAVGADDEGRALSALERVLPDRLLPIAAAGLRRRPSLGVGEDEVGSDVSDGELSLSSRGHGASFRR